MPSPDSPMPFSSEQCADFPKASLVYIQATEQNHVLEIRLNRPDKRNAFDPVLVRELAWALSYAHHQPAVWVVVLAANGPVFCAGADLKAFAGMGTPDPGSPAPELPADTPIGDLFRHLHKPCIARVHGDVLAGGFLLIGGCTHVLAAETARFGLPEVRRGIWPMQVMATLAEIMPARDLLDWCMRGLVLDARQAQAKGLVTQVCQAEELDTALQALLDDLLAQSPSAIRLGLQAWDSLRRIAPAEQHRYLQGMLAQVLQTADAREGLAAFREKRDPVWTGE